MRNLGYYPAVAGCALSFVLAATGAAAGAPLENSPARLESAEPAESPRMIRAKDLISEEQWVAAIAELRAAVADPSEQSKAEALFWLAHSQNQAGDLAEAVDSIRRLQNDHARSRWSAPAYSLLIELAQKLGRQDVLWRMAPPAPPPPPPPGAAVARPAGPRTPRTRDTPPPPPMPAGAAVPAPPPVPPAAPPPMTWVAESYLPDTDLRIQALGRLILTDAKKVIPMLRSIALEPGNPTAARRAVFVLAQSRHPEAQMMVVDVANHGAEPVRVAAVRELGRFGGANVSQELLKVYSKANVPVKQQVVVSLGQRADTTALVQICESESDASLREAAIVTLGRAGGREQLRLMYTTTPRSARQAVIRGLFNAKDEDGLIRIADQEKDPQLRRYALERLRLLGTPRAEAYLEKNK